jgi:hypothetical protein
MKIEGKFSDIVSDSQPNPEFQGLELPAIAAIRAANDREKLDIFKGICDLRIQSIGIEFPDD